MKELFYDSDRHVVEPLDLWEDYLPKRFQKYAMRIVHRSPHVIQIDGTVFSGGQQAVSLVPELYFDNQPLFDNLTPAYHLEVSQQSDLQTQQIYQAATSQGQLESMDAMGIQVAYLFPTYASLMVYHQDINHEVSTALAHAYNLWLHDYCSQNPSRLRGVGLISRHSPEKMVQELERIAQWGWTCIMLRPEVICERVVGHADYEDFWARCESMGVAVAFHGGTHLHGPTVGTERFNTRFALHACSHPMEAQMAFLSLLESGVFERYPRLKVAFLEAGASWIPYWLWRLDEICYGTTRAEVARHVRMKPSEYFKRQCWIGMEVEEPCLNEAAQFVGADRLLYGSDFPHLDHTFSTVEALHSKCELSKTHLLATLGENPKAFFGA